MIHAKNETNRSPRGHAEGLMNVARWRPFHWVQQAASGTPVGIFAARET
jgi:hypothetical protein